MRWGIVGFGWVARDFMAPGIAAADGRVAAVCDPDPSARAAAEALGARAYPDLAAMLAAHAGGPSNPDSADSPDSVRDGVRKNELHSMHSNPRPLDAVNVADLDQLRRAAVEACPDLADSPDSVRDGVRGAEVHSVHLMHSNSSALDAVYVATPNHLHRTAVEACAAAGVAVLCEKPMAATLADAQAMVAACAGRGVLLGTAFDQRRHPAHRAIRDAVAAGRIGAPTAVRIVYGCWLGRDWSGGEGCNGANWRIDPGQAGGGAVMDLAPHGLDLVDYLLGEPVVALSGLLQTRVQDYGVDDGGMLVGRTASGVLVAIHNSYNTPEALPRRRLEVVGSAGQITATETMGQDPGGAVVFSDGATGRLTPMRFDRLSSPFAEQARAFEAALRGEAHDFDPARDLAGMRLLAGVYAEDAASRAVRDDVA